jgi:tetratricopeptide (TPR) repeat protein
VKISGGGDIDENGPLSLE